MDESGRPRRPWLLGLVLVAITGVVVVALATSEISGTGAENVGDTGGPRTGERPSPTDEPRPAAAQPSAPRRCQETASNPGGTNNFIPDAPLRASLGEGFLITGLVRSAAGCRPLPGVRVQVWLATRTGGETDNRASVRTGPDGRYRIETDPTVPQFGEPNIHVAYDDGRYRKVYIRRVVDLDDTRAVVNLTLARRG